MHEWGVPLTERGKFGYSRVGWALEAGDERAIRYCKEVEVEVELIGDGCGAPFVAG